MIAQIRNDIASRLNGFLRGAPSLELLAQLEKVSCERRKSRAAARRSSERRRSFLCELRRRRRIQSAMREQLQILNGVATGVCGRLG